MSHDPMYTEGGIAAFRCFRVEDGYLELLVRSEYRWKPGPQEADAIPARENHSGFWGFKTLSEAIYQEGRADDLVFALTEHWGRMTEHETGLRSQYAEIMAEEYNPLLVRRLFLEFAELAEGGEITQDDWLDWTKRWGVLGVDWREGPVKPHRGGRREKFSIFKSEAELANWVLRLYEAATAENGPDMLRIRELLELDDDDTSSAKEIKKWALLEVARTVQRRLIGECFPRLYGLKDYSFVHSPSGFGSLVGAMYLQMMYLIAATDKNTGKEIKRCAGPGCNKIIYFDESDLPDDPKIKGRAVRGTYRNRDYCSTNCRVKRWQRDQKNKKN